MKTNQWVFIDVETSRAHLPNIILSSVVGGCGGTVEPGGCGVEGYVPLDLPPLPNIPAVASLSLLLNCLDSIGSGSLPIVPAKKRTK